MHYCFRAPFGGNVRDFLTSVFIFVPSYAETFGGLVLFKIVFIYLLFTLKNFTGHFFFMNILDLVRRTLFECFFAPGYVRRDKGGLDNAITKDFLCDCCGFKFLSFCSNSTGVTCDVCGSHLVRRVRSHEFSEAFASHIGFEGSSGG